jgi:hypothetical protein
MFLFDGVCVDGDHHRCFQGVEAPDKAELESLVRAVSERVGRYLECQVVLARDMDNSYVALEPSDETGGSSITDRVAIDALPKAARPLPCKPCRRKATRRRAAPA